jgi:hypothetical protein
MYSAWRDNWTESTFVFNREVPVLTPDEIPLNVHRRKNWLFGLDQQR